jgi:hypothetical protein
MASEDSDELSPGLLAVHRLSDLGYPDEPFIAQVDALVDQFDAARELIEVPLFRGMHRMSPEERDDPLDEIDAFAHDVAIQVLAMVVVPLVRNDHSHPEELLKLVQAANALRSLRDNELVSHLIAGSVAVSASPTWLPDEADREASFSVYKTNNPAESNQPFLLVFCTDRIVTAHRLTLGRVPDGYSGFPAYSRMLTVTLLLRRATNLP